jgi:hypothetical protein
MTEPERPSAKPPQKPAPPAGPPGLGALFESAVTAAYDPSEFRRAAARPAPGFGAAGGLALAAGAAALGINWAHAVVSNPGFIQRFSPPILAAVAVAALGLYSSLLLILAVLLYAMGNGCGGKGGFERGLQAVAMLSILVPLQMLCNWFPLAWIVPALLAGWVASGALEGLFLAPAGPARAICAVLAAGAIGLQFVGREMADRARDAYALAQPVAGAADEQAKLASELRAVQDRTQDIQSALSASAAAPASSPAPVSSLDLLRGGLDSVAAQPQNAAPAAAAIAAPPPALASSAAGMLDAVAPLLASIAASKNATPEMKADFKELNGLIGDLKGQLASGKPVDRAVFAQKMARYQQLLVKVMTESRPSSAPAANPTPHLQLPGDGK